MRALRPDHQRVPLPRRYSPRHAGFDESMALHAAAIADRLPVYLDPTTGLAVFTAQFLADRGYCCDSGCRHCPYEPVQR